MNKKFVSRIFIRIRNIIYLSILLLTGCHSQNMHLTTKTFSGNYNTFKNAITFFKEIHLWLPASGIAAIPDGGMPRTLYKNTSLYHFQVERKSLTKIYDFGNLPYNYSRWKSKTSYGTSKIVFSITPIEGWRDFAEINPEMKKYETMYRGVFLCSFLSHNHNRKQVIRISTTGEYPIISTDDSMVIYTKEEKGKYSLEMYNLNNNKSETLVDDLDIEPTISFFKDKKTAYWLLQNGEWLKINVFNKKTTRISSKSVVENSEVPTKTLEELMGRIPYAEWGFNLAEHYPRSTKGFINDIVKRKGNLEYRIAVLQMLKRKLPPQKLHKIVNKLISASESPNPETSVLVKSLFETLNSINNI